jgi:hypothetical protein
VESPNLALLQKTANPTNPLAVFIQPKVEDQTKMAKAPKNVYDKRR